MFKKLLTIVVLTALSPQIFASADFGILSKDNECPICLDDNFDEIAKYPCGHAVCRKDYEENAERFHSDFRNPPCPMCNVNTGIADLYTYDIETGEYLKCAEGLSVKQMYPEMFKEVERFHRFKIKEARQQQALILTSIVGSAALACYTEFTVLKPVLLGGVGVAAVAGKKNVMKLQETIQNHKRKLEEGEL